MLTSCSAGLTLLLAGLGLFGLVGYRVVTRTREIDLRMALGAGRMNVLGLVLKDALLPVVAGAAVGLPCAVGGGRIIQDLLVGVTPSDPTAMSITAICAAFLRARRALSLEPIEALKENRATYMEDLRRAAGA